MIRGRLIAVFLAILMVFTLLLNGTRPASGQSPVNYRAEAIVLINSSSVNASDFSHYIQPYLDHFGVPYTIVDISTDPLPMDLSSYALIIIGHNQLDISNTFLTQEERQQITDAVNSGTGLI